jgi:hypothetical protein
MKDFNNPLFESLVFKANRYGMLDEQESSGKAPSGAVYQDFAVSLTTIGSKLVENYIKAVAGYPETAWGNWCGSWARNDFRFLRP